MTRRHAADEHAAGEHAAGEHAAGETAFVPGARPAPEQLSVEQPAEQSAANLDSDETEPASAETGPARDPAGAGLDERGAQVLAFERQWWKHAGAKEQAIRDTFGLSATRYYQVLNALLDDPAALAHDPVLVGRLRRLRASRVRRSA